MPRTYNQRSFLFVPAINERAVAKAANLPADSIILDLEDSVSHALKADARARVQQVLGQGVFGDKPIIVRLNALKSAYIADDLRSLQGTDIKSILLPKVENIQDVLQIEALLDALRDLSGVKIWVMIENALGVLNASDILSHPRVSGCVIGPNDLRVDLGCQKTPNRSELMMSLQTCLLAARAHGKVCIDGVYNAFGDTDGFGAECRQGRQLGFDGKSLIHPSQIDIANKTYGASDDEIARAQEIVSAFENSEQFVVNLNGEMIEELHMREAQMMLDQVAKQKTET